MASPDSGRGGTLPQGRHSQMLTAAPSWLTVAALFTYKPLNGKRIAIVTHAGGPAVMLTDALSEGGLADTAIYRERLPTACLRSFSRDRRWQTRSISWQQAPLNSSDISSMPARTILSEIDAMAVIFGSPGTLSCG
ncbi:MAG: hypothetical protein MZV63_05665 [Marinilabiliales bacterium]|nr:hypothetical protein [Marinilabiliales bacterium]